MLMKKDVSVEAKKTQFMIEKAMDDITRATRIAHKQYTDTFYHQKLYCQVRLYYKSLQPMNGLN